MGAMLTADVLKFFGGNSDDDAANTAAIKAVAAALNIKVPSVYGWGERVPPLRQMQLEIITDGKLRADPGLANPSAAAPQQAALLKPRREQMRG
jgi:hypothetical protein